MFLHQRFIPEFLQGRSDSTKRTYINAVSALCKFLCRDPDVDEITDGMTQDFRASLIARGVGPNTAKIWYCGIRAIVHHARPDVFVPQGKAAKPNGSGWDAKYVEDLNVEGSLWRFFHDIYRVRKMVGCSDDSKEQHEIAIRRLCRYAGHSVLVSELNEDLVASYLQWMLDNGLERATVNTTRGCILANWRLAHKRKLIVEAPECEKIRGNRKLPTAFSMEEFEKLLVAAIKTPGRIGPLPAGNFWFALLLTLYFSGLRLRAAMSIRREDVDLETGWLSVPADVQKQRVEQHSVCRRKLSRPCSPSGSRSAASCFAGPSTATRSGRATVRSWPELVYQRTAASDSTN